MNKACLVGRITKDIELRFTKNGKAVTEFPIAINRNHKNQNGEYETDFINIQVWDKSADNISKFCKKGDMIGIVGSLRNETYETENGKRYKDYVLAESVMFLQPKQKEEQTDYQNVVTKDIPEEMKIQESDLPF